MANRRVSLVRRVQIDGKWKFVCPVVSDKGRVSPELVKIGGQIVRANGGLWHVTWYEAGKKVRNPVGPSFTKAVAEKFRQEQLMGARNAGIEIPADDHSRPKLSDRIEVFLGDLRLRDRQDETVQAYALVLNPFQDCCQRTFLEAPDLSRNR